MYCVKYACAACLTSNKYDGIKKEYEMMIKELCAESTYDTKLTEIFRELVAA